MGSHLHSRSALTVVEVLVALMLVSVGLLGIAGTSALSLRSAVAAVRERRATHRATTRLARLAAAGCERATNGSLEEPDLHEQWSVVPSPGGLALADAVVEWRDRGAQWRSLRLRSAFLC